MSKIPKPSPSGSSIPPSSWVASRDAAIADFLDRFADCPDRDLLADMMVTITRLARDGTGRGDLKLLSKAFKELRYAFKIFAPYRDVRKVSIFGSSRTPADHPDYIQADAFARRMRERRWMVITGAGDGIMRAGHDGAGRDASFGVAIRLPFEQNTNAIIADDPKLINFKYFFTRKLLFLKEASAIALFPGGFGTQDEGFEVLTLIQTGKTDLMPIVLIDAPGGTYWQHWRTYVKAELLRNGMINDEDMNLFSSPTTSTRPSPRSPASTGVTTRCATSARSSSFGSPRPFRPPRSRGSTTRTPRSSPTGRSNSTPARSRARTTNTPRCLASRSPSTARTPAPCACSSTTSTRRSGKPPPPATSLISGGRILHKTALGTSAPEST